MNTRQRLAAWALCTLAIVFNAWGFDPATDSPRSLMAVPPDGVGYYRDRMEARRLWRERKYAEAEPFFERITAEYPRDAWSWMTLARGPADRMGRRIPDRLPARGQQARVR